MLEKLQAFTSYFTLWTVDYDTNNWHKACLTDLPGDRVNASQLFLL